MKLFSYKRIVSFLLALSFLMPFTPSIVNAESENEVQESQVEEIEQSEITSPIVINEIVPDTDNVDGADGYEFFELQNISNSEINFNNYKVLYNSTDIWTLDNADIVLNPGELLVVWIKNNGNQSLTIDDFNNYYQSNLVEGVNFTTVQSNGLNNSNQRDLSKISFLMNLQHIIYYNQKIIISITYYNQ